MRYKVSLKKTEEGYSVWVPGLPGCWSEGRTEDGLSTIPRVNPVDAFTMAGIVKDAGLAIEEFKKLL